MSELTNTFDQVSILDFQDLETSKDRSSNLRAGEHYISFWLFTLSHDEFIPLNTVYFCFRIGKP